MAQNTTTTIQALLLADSYLRDQVMEQVILQPGEILFQRGDPGDSLYIVETGSIRIYILNAQGQEITINHILPGQCLGELAIIDDQTRSASAMATGPSQLLRLGRDAFLQEVYQSRALNRCLLTLLSERIRHMTNYVEQLGLWAKCIAQEDYGIMADILAQMDLQDDPVLVTVADALKTMVQAIRDREQNLQEHLQELRIHIDQDSLQKKVDSITDTDYFQSLLEKSRERRAKRQNHREIDLSENDRPS